MGTGQELPGAKSLPHPALTPLSPQARPSFLFGRRCGGSGLCPGPGGCLCARQCLVLVPAGHRAGRSLHTRTRAHPCTCLSGLPRRECVSRWEPRWEASGTGQLRTTEPLPEQVRCHCRVMPSVPLPAPRPQRELRASERVSSLSPSPSQRPGLLQSLHRLPRHGTT